MLMGINEIDVGNGIELMRRVVEESKSEIGFRIGIPAGDTAIRNRSISKFMHLTGWTLSDVEELYDNVVL